MGVRRIVLSGGDYITALKVLLATLTPDVMQAYHEFMAALVESIRYRDRAITGIVMMVDSLDKNLAKQYAPMRSEIVAVVRDLAMSLYFQAEEFKLYNDKSILMYVYYRHPDFAFDDVVLSGIIPLGWNGVLYEPYL